MKNSVKAIALFGAILFVAGASVFAAGPNVVKNPSFEDKDVSMWVLQDLSADKMNELYVEDKKDNAVTGTKTVHFWSKKPVHFKVTQKITGLAAGAYTLTAVGHGGDVGSQAAINLIATAGGKDSSAPFKLDGWKKFSKPQVVINVGSDGTAVIGAEVTCAGGGWGNFDDFSLTAN